MRQELIDYIVDYYMKFFTEKEKAAYKHYHTSLKTEDTGSSLTEVMLRHWGTKDSETLKLLDGGYEKFKRDVAKRILENHREDIFINNCPICGKLARTPNALQCRFCGHDWR